MLCIAITQESALAFWSCSLQFHTPNKVVDRDAKFCFADALNHSTPNLRQTRGSESVPLVHIGRRSDCATRARCGSASAFHSSNRLSQLSKWFSPSLTLTPHPTRVHQRTFTTVMFKQRHRPGSPGYVPGTPKFPKLSLPPVETGNLPSRPVTRAGMRPSTPAMPSNNPRANPTSGQPVKPLRPILKKTGIPAPAHTSYDSEGEILTSKNVVRSHDAHGHPPAPGVRKVHIQTEVFDLHWQLLPFDRSRSKRLMRFDVAFPIESIRFQERDHRSKLADSDLDKPAANRPLTKMLINFASGPFEWDVNVKNARGITCRDVLEAIYDTFNEQLTLYERKLIPPHLRKECEEAFKLRCKVVPGLEQVEFRQGLKRVDVLRHGTIFLGLTQPKSDGDWTLNLGKWPF